MIELGLSKVFNALTSLIISVSYRDVVRLRPISGEQFPLRTRKDTTHGVYESLFSLFSTSVMHLLTLGQVVVSIPQQLPSLLFLFWLLVAQYQIFKPLIAGISGTMSVTSSIFVTFAVSTWVI